MKEAILITGITGFLGSNIGRSFVANGYRVIATRRESSNIANCTDFTSLITWIDIDKVGWKDSIIELRPIFIIHAAWIGVQANERNDWAKQTKNLLFLQDLLGICKHRFVKKIIALGSQAEYGHIDSIVAEDAPLNPSTAYGAVKIIASQIIEEYSKLYSFEWYWLRVFTVFGEGEGLSWLLPSLISTIKMGEKKSMDFSAGEQKYSYLYIKDFVKCIESIVAFNLNKSGIYNLSSSNIFSIKEVITTIRDNIDSQFSLNFGVLPYRSSQSMLIVGDSDKFITTFGQIDTISFQISIKNTISYYMVN